MTGTAQTIVTFLLNQDKNKVFDLNEHKEKRSLNANGYLWILCEKIAKELSKDGVMTTKEDVYKEGVRYVGVFTPVIVEEKAFDKFKQDFESQGLGNQVSEVVRKNKCVRCNCYYGSSTYNTAEMSRLIDFIVQECQQLSIETKSADEIRSLINNEINNAK